MKWQAIQVVIFVVLMTAGSYIIGLYGAMLTVTTRIKRRFLTMSKLGRVLAAILWPLALVLLALMALGKKLNQHMIQPFLRDWHEMLNHQ